MDATYTGTQIAARRKALNLTQKELAAKLHVTDKAVSKWERGINFPDLGLMEPLAEALGTPPACLLGLEEASRDEIVSSVTQISEEQLEDAQRDLRRIGWGCILAALLLVWVYALIPRQTPLVYQIVHVMILIIAVGGFWLLVKYGEIRKWNTGDWLVCYGAALPVLIWNGIYFLTGYSPNAVLTLMVAAITACMTQLLFFRILRHPFMKALPALASVCYVLWRIWRASLPFYAVLVAGCCLATWAVCRKFCTK